MRLFPVKLVLILCVLMVGLTTGMHAQTHISFHIFVFDDFAAGDTTTLIWGTDNAATRGIDEPLGEVEIPPGPPSFDARFSNSQLGSGTVVDYLPVSHTATRIDTFIIQITNGDGASTNADFGLMWNHDFAARVSDTMTLKIPAGSDIDGNPINARKINMRLADSVYIPAAQFWGIKNLTIITRIDTSASPASVKPLPDPIPSAFALGHNYPNPFNPTTTIRFDIAKSAMTDIAVYNILGQKVTTLVSQELRPGVYSTVWNGTSAQGSLVGSGVYFVRMSARSLDNGIEQFSSLQKVLLMK